MDTNDTTVYLHDETLRCAEVGCTPCLYKIYPTGHCNEIKLPPNTRPEMCPRSKQAMSTWDYYKPHHHILTLGDGDLSYSCAIAKLIDSKNQKQPRTSNVVATTHESREQLLQVYPQFPAIDHQLRSIGADVRHGVDATALAATFPTDNYSNYFDFIIWNFPCIRMPKGADGQVEELETNKLLLRKFFENCAYLLKRQQDRSTPEGEVHLTHKTIEPFSWWGIEKIAADSGFQCRSKIVFDKYLFPGYVNKKVLDNKSFPLHDARVSVFS